MDRFIGKRLDGRYEIQELAGIGGMANVYKAYDLTGNRTVAVKILREEFLDNEEFLRRFRNESKAIAVLSHPNIVKVYDVSPSAKMPSIVMEYIQGVTLKDYIELKGILRWKEAVHFTVQILRALQHAHDNGIVHRDVKPQNVMLMADGTIKITDFGIARFSRSVSHTLTNRALGSVHYISPEQARGEPADQKADLYSVGVMLYEMLTGRLPFEADSPVSVAIKQIESQAIRPRELNPDIPEGLEAITMRAMQKDPERRYQSASEMLRDIDEFKRNPSIVFEYQYMTREPISGAARSVPAGKQPARGKKKPPPPHSDKAPIIPVLSGITVAFVLASLIFVGLMIYFNNPFQTVEDIALPNLVGQRYDDVRFDPQFVDNFQIVAQEPEYNAEFEKGVIFDQDPQFPKNVKLHSTIRVKVSSGAQMVTLPDFAGQEATAVFKKLAEMGLEYESSSIYSNVVQSGYVVKTDPGKSMQVAAGTTVTVYVSRGTDQKMTETPRVEGEELDTAKTLIKNANLNASVLREPSDEVPEGTVISQEPAPGTTIPEDSTVTITVSTGESTSGGNVSLMVVLPSGEGEVLLKAKQNGEKVLEERVNLEEKRVWRPSFSGEGIVTVEILLDGDLYQEYTVDFDTGDKTVEVDNSGDY